MVQTAFQNFLRQYPSLAYNSTWLIAVSGGVDSVVLCHLAKANQIPFAIAHCNFQLRGDESNRDKAFVRDLAQGFNVPLFVKDFDTKQYMADEGKSVQVAAREIRYDWFAGLLQQMAQDSPLKTQVIATAHHANDNIETVLMNLFRGSGIKGLRGIVPVQGKIIRPMLGVGKEAIVNYAESNGLCWVEDSSNSSDKYTRNLVRNKVIPLMEQAIPRDEICFEKSLGLLSEAEMLYDEAIALHKKKLVETRGVEHHIPVLKLAASKPLRTITYEIIKDFGFNSAQTDEVLALLNSKSGRYVGSATHRIIRNRAWFIIAPQKTEGAGLILIEEQDKKVTFSGGVLAVKQEVVQSQMAIPKAASLALLDATEIHFPLILRPWKPGDYFYPLGMMKKKKLARFFIDQKLSKTEKESIWVIESDKKILWVIGHRIDERYKVTDRTKTVLWLDFAPVV
ncbi:MAG: tRNA lysidine(34) synthetase TilS [Chitinophagaceae bacterium]